MIRRMRMRFERLRGRLRVFRMLWRRAEAERELADEFAHHIELETEQNIRRGVSPSAARRAALLAFGGVERYAERVRAVRWTRWGEETVQDVAYGVRGLLRRPTFTIAAMLTLALGIGVNAAFYGFIDATVNRMPTAVPASDRLVRLENRRFDRLSHPDFRDLSGSVDGEVKLAAWRQATGALTSGGDPVRISVELVSGNFFDLLDLRPARGRFFLSSDDEVAGRDAVVVLSHSLWRQRFNGADSVVGSTIILNAHPFTVVGIAPAGFRGLEARADLWVPIMVAPFVMTWDILDDRRSPNLRVFGRLAPGVSLERAKEVLAVASARLPDADRFEPVQPDLTPLRGRVPLATLADRISILAFIGLLTGFTLLICCSNIAGLQLSRAVVRARELGVRIALGAGRSRLVRLLLAESLLLAVGAGAIGVLIGYWLSSTLRARFAGPFAALDLTPNAATLLFTLVVTLATAMMFGLVPALIASRPDVLAVINSGEPRFGRPGRLRAALVVSQVGLSIVLLTVTALFIGRLREIQRIDPGFDVDRFAAFSVDLSTQGYDDDQRMQFARELRDRLKRLPGVAAVAAPTALPLAGGGALVLVGTAPVERPSVGETASTAQFSIGAEAGASHLAGAVAIAVGVAGNFFQVLGVPAVRGRLLIEDDLLDETEPVAVINTALAERLFPAADPIGRMIYFADSAYRMVGTVPALAMGGLENVESWRVFVPTTHFSQQSTVQSVLVRAAGNPAALLPALRAEALRVRPGVPIFDPHVLRDRLREQLDTQRALTGLITAFGVVALLLALVGVFSVVAATVSSRKREIGVRIALGARGTAVVWLFVGKGIVLALWGAAGGALLALAVGRLISSSVWGVRPFDLGALGLAAASLLIAAALASWLPARRAARVDPVHALSQD